MNKFLSSSTSGISEDRVREIIEDISVIYNDDSSVSINNSANASIYTLPTVSGVAGNSVVVGADGKHLVFTTLTGLTNPLTDVLDANNNSIVNIYRLGGTGLGPELLIDSHVNMLNYTMKNLTSIQGSGGKLELISSNLHMNSGIIYGASSIVGAGLNNDLLISGSITLNGDINMANFTLNNVRNVNKSSINLSLIPATAGLPGQVLTRASNFDIKDPLTAQLVWTTPSGGGVQNPMTVDLDAGNFNINNVETLTATYVDTDNINPKTGSTILITGDLNLNSNGLTRVDKITCRTTANPSADLFLDLIPATIGTAGQVLARDPAFTGGINNNKLVWQNGGVQNPMTSDLNGGGLNITNLSSLTTTELKVSSINLASGTIIQTSPLAVNTQLKVNTINTLTNPTIAMPSVDFSGTIKTNTINTYSGDTISCLQNLTLADSKQLKSTLMFSDGLRSNTTDLILAGLLPDNKTQSNIFISSPVISLDNQFGPLVQDTTVNLTGNLIFNNALSTPIIQGSSLTIRGRTPAGSATPIVLESTILNIVSSSSVNVSASSINFDKNINLLAGRGQNINPSMVLYRTIGLPSVAYDIRNGTTYVNVTTGQTGRGSKTIPANGLSTFDLYKFNLIGVMSCDAKIDMTFSIYAGSDRICTFTCSGDALTNQGFEFTTTLNVRTVSLGVVSLSTGIGKFEKDGKQISYAVPINVTNLIVANSNTFDIYMKPVSTMSTGSVSIYNFSIENV